MRAFRLFDLAVALCSLTTFLVTPALVEGQEPDSAHFHPGQWGVDFRIGSGFAAAGALHFTSPTRATLLELSSGYSHGSISGPVPTARTSNVDAALSVGRRAYRTVDPHVYRWTTMGLSVLYDRQSSSQNSLTTTAQGLGAGVFANIGAGWLVTPHLGLGAQWQVGVTYNHRSASGSFTSDIVTVVLAQVALTGQLYF